ncbi:FeoA family protein [Citromicrobium bathyomarinum]|uniref:FeoA family protein n=1 Tax=Sphingomonadales TaxID=204457 RepID=UPI000C501F76|nr:ferrous iron transport protein A [Citromicrobium sp.]MBO79901.1 ferrous iron transport protein A [Citromicrobium sp.]|tara:strand:- start:2401 stop:2640 length:240 start_codon:yes stop_codon:yes gene_type:complete
MTLESLKPGHHARIAAIDWSALPPADAKRMRALGFETGVEVGMAHHGVFGGRDPVAVSIGRMTIALRKSQASAILLEAD